MPVQQNNNINERRMVSVYVIIMIFAGIVFFKLYTIALSDYAKILPTLTNQYTRKMSVVERRGFIFDRNGDIIAGFDNAYNCIVDPSKIPLINSEGKLETLEDISQNIFEICENANTLPEDILKNLREGRPFIIRILENINNEYMTSFQSYKRNASSNPAALHITGYVNREGDGISGIEQSYNDLLKKTSAKIDAVYASNAIRQSFGGSPIRIIDYGYYDKTGIALTLDINLQRKAEEIADKYLNKGAVVIVSASTGEILASVSRPVYSLDNISDYIESENGEFINRAFSSFTPGSVFKTIIAAAALEKDEESDNYFNYYNKEYNCTGEINVSGKIFRCNRKWGHGVLNMCEAYAESCNTYFMNLALEIGYDCIYETAKKLGIGSRDMLDGLNIKSGNIPDIKNPPPAFTANTAIGQGELLITPLEAARIFCCIANNGELPELSIVKSFILSPENTNQKDIKTIRTKKVLSDSTVNYLLEMTQACVEYGTGTIAAPEYGIAGGKTSSAESGQYKKIEILNPETEEFEIQTVQIVHSWFSGYYPANADINQPTYVISVIAEGGVTENIKSALIFKEVCDYLTAIINN